jgi:hypothetical protein
MSDEAIPHTENDTPDLTDADVKRMDADTEQNAQPGAGANQGAGSDGPTGGGDIQENSDPKAGGGNQQVKDPKESAGQHQEKG